MNNFIFSSFVVRLFLIFFFSSFFAISSVSALNVTSGVFIQTVDEATLLDSANMEVAEFFNAEESAKRLIDGFKDDLVQGDSSLPANKFVYEINSPTLAIEGRSTWPSSFTYSADDVTGTGVGAIGLAGVMRFGLPNDEYFLMGDWTIEYDAKRIEDGGSGWFMTNEFQIPVLAIDILDETIITGPDSFFLSGYMGWSPEFTKSFSGAVPEKETYRKIASFVMCAQDDEVIAANSAKQIPCVFPNITINGKTGDVEVNSVNEASLALDLGLATNESYPSAEYFVAFHYEGEFYWLNQNLEWTTTTSVVHQGALVDIRSFAIPKLPVTPSSGASIPIYFGVDTNQNGAFDEPYRYSTATIMIN